MVGDRPSSGIPVPAIAPDVKVGPGAPGHLIQLAERQKHHHPSMSLQRGAGALLPHCHQSSPLCVSSPPPSFLGSSWCPEPLKVGMGGCLSTWAIQMRLSRPLANECVLSWVYNGAPYPTVRKWCTHTAPPLVMSGAPPKSKRGSACKLGAPQAWQWQCS